jgi:hypothetical protein
MEQVFFKKKIFTSMGSSCNRAKTVLYRSSNGAKTVLNRLANNFVYEAP